MLSTGNYKNAVTRKNVTAGGNSQYAQNTFFCRGNLTKICENMLVNLAMRYKTGFVCQVFVENISIHGIIFISQIGSCRIRAEGEQQYDGVNRCVCLRRSLLLTIRKVVYSHYELLKTYGQHGGLPAE